MRSILMLLLSLTMMAVLVGCGAKAAALKPYKMEIQQGNVVTSKMLLQLRPGMTKSQVRYIMGTPLIVDSFHNNRWDYYFQLRQAGKIVQQRRVILDFENDLLSHVRGDVVPEGTPGADTSAAPISKSIAKPKEDNSQKDKSLVDKLKFWKKDEAPAEKPLESQPELVKPDDAPVSTPKPATSDVKPADTKTEESQTQEEQPSMLAVPIPLLPSKETPSKVDPTPPAMLNKPDTEPASPADNSSSAVKTTPIESAPVVAKPPSAEKEVIQPTKQTNTDTKKPLIIDRSMDETAKPVAATAKPVAQPPANTQQQVEKLKSESTEDQLDPEPGYFERLLEKIGF